MVFLQKNGTAIEVCNNQDHSYTQYPIRNPAINPQPPCETHLTNNLYQVKKGIWNIPRKRKWPMWDGSNTLKFINNGILWIDMDYK